MTKFLKLNSKVTIILLFAIFIFAFLLRVSDLGNYPVGFHIDEASLGYNGYSLLLTGKDDSSKAFPLYIDMFGDNRPSGYHYLVIIPIIFFGLTEFATRLPAAFFGSLSVFPVFYLAYLLFKDRKVALLSALLLAITPWNFVLSRASSEAIVSLFFIIAGVAFIIDGIQKEKIVKIIPGAILLTSSFFFYHTTRVFVPILFIAIIMGTFTVWKKYTGKFKIALLSSFILVSTISAGLVFLVAGGTGRYSQVNIFSSFEVGFQQTQQLLEDNKAGAGALSIHAFHNKYANYFYTFTHNYLVYFNGEFLFTKGGLPIWYSVPRIGMLLAIELPFILVGIFYLVLKKNLWYKLVLLWLILGPVVASITLDDVPNINRASVMLPMWELICAFGFIMFLSHFKRKNLYAIIAGMMLIFNFLYFTHQYYINAAVHNPWYRNNGFAEMMKKINLDYEKYDHVVISKYQGGAYPLVLFYSKYDPAKYQKEGSPKDKDYSGFGKFFFVPQDCPFLQTSPEYPLGKRIYVEKGGCPDDKALLITKHKFILRTDDTRAFRIVYESISTKNQK